MRRILATCILLSPMLFTAAASASQPKDDASASTSVRPISTGVTAPRILHTTDVVLTPEQIEMIPNDAEVVLNVNVSKNGTPDDIQVVKSPNPLIDQRVVEAVRQFRWSPATLDNQDIPLDLTLKVMVQR
jgi:TonB family protein